MSSAVSSTSTVTCGPIIAGGDSLVRRPGDKVMFVEGGMPGEEVEVAVVEERKDLVRAKVLRVITPAAARIEPPCPVYLKGCGGCQWQHMSAESQQQAKVDIVTDALTRISKLPDLPVRFAGAVSQFDYRTTLRLPVVDGQASLRRRHTNDTVPLETCLIAHPSLRELVTDVSYGNATEVRLRVSVATGERIAWITGDGSHTLPDDVVVTRNGRKAAVHEDVLGSRFRLSARSFFQSGPAAATLLVETVAAHVPDDTGLLLDAYAGVGVFAGVIGRRVGARVVTIEQDGTAVNDSKENLAELDARIILGEVAAVRPGDVELPDVIIADPARSGLGPSASRALAALQAKRIVLVNCDPASLARDVNLLRDNGYNPVSLDVLDLFPQTHHVETVTVFDR
jgi:23S rRNA (uracil1939-C5)-methyltransferase